MIDILEIHTTSLFSRLNLSKAFYNKKFFKHVMKLDKNFHVYVHGNPELIERGFDEQRQMKFYKLYYTNETHPD